MSNSKNTSQWRIEARAFFIPFTPFTHNFWALVNSTGNIVEQIPGLAVDPKTGTTRAIGNSSHLLQAINAANFLWALQPGQTTVVCATVPITEIRRRWQTAVNSIPAINALKLRYPNLWQHFYKPNSNTVFKTIGQIMGFSEPSRLLPARAPGINLVISREIVEQYSYIS